MNKIFKILIPAAAAAIVLGGFANVALAQSGRIQFQATPLFSEVNFAPGSSITRWVKLNNDTAEPHRALVRAVNSVNSGDFKLGDVVRLVIRDGATVWYDGTFTDFFSEPEVLLEQIPAGTERTYDFVVIFDANSGNNYQNSTMGFNLQIGFEELETTTDTTTTISGEIGGSGGGSTSGSRHLVISGESAVNQEPAGSGVVVAVWTTNIPATSQVIYGPAGGGPYDINMSLAYFGYPYGTSEQDLGKVTDHSVTISGLAPGEYSYRVVSRASPATISYEHKFVVAAVYQTGSEDIITADSLGISGEGEILGASSEKVTPEDDGGAVLASDNNLAAILTAGWGNLPPWWLWLLLILAVIYLFWRFALRPGQK